MRYLLLVYADEELLPDLMTSDAVGQFEALSRELASEGRLQMTARLASVASATAVRVRGGKLMLTDGPNAETREQLGGFSLAVFDSEEAALAMAARVPMAVAGCIEVRRVAEFSTRADGAT